MINNIKAIVTDIEGTTSSLSFVKDVLFPYASEHLEDFIRTNADQPFVTKLIYQVLGFSNEGSLYDNSPCDVAMQSLTEEQINRAIEFLQHWIKLDMKIKPLKDLQGLIWEEGYKNGDFHGHIYDDAYEKLKEWHEQGIKLYVYSSGSVHAQKLLFGHTKFGDLNYLFSGNFDTSIGHKREARSYVNIIEAINKDILGVRPDNILFLSDIEEELKAASDTGIRVEQLVREDDSMNFNLCKKAHDFYGIALN